jgi:ribosome-associated toxin RatA of RatAB toxin-antitoxin module
VSQQGQTTTVHEVAIEAPAEVVYGIVADAVSWPQLFPPNIHVERAELGPGEEQLRVWAMANGEIKAWTSRRRLDAAALRVEFAQETPSPPVAAMGGTWEVRRGPADGCSLTLTHCFAAVDGDPGGRAWIAAATEHNSQSELAGIKALAERLGQRSELTFSFEDSMVVHGSAGHVYAFLRDADQWPRRLPHVASLDMREDIPDLQLMSMTSQAADGSTHVTRSARVCFPEHRIVYKQLVTPALLTSHTGEWLVEPVGDRDVRVSARHTVTLNEPAIEKVLGPSATIASAKDFVRSAIGANSRATLEHANDFAQARHG